MLRIVIILIALTIKITGQEITNWQNFSNMEDVVDIAIDENEIWAATNGGVFSYSLIDSSYKILTKSEGLSSQTVTAIAVDKNKNIWIGSIDGYINVYNTTTGKIETIREIHRTNNPQKGINDITISGDTAFVSTDFGLSLINVNNLSFFDSILKFGTFPSRTPVKNVYLGSTILVVTNAGLTVKKKNANNLTAPETWETVNTATINNINKVVEYKNSLFAATDNGLVKILNNTGSVILYNNFEVLDIKVKDSFLYSVISQTTVKNKKTEKILNSINRFNGTTNEVIIDLSSKVKKFNTLNLDINNKYIMATNKGIAIYANYDTITVYPNGPKTNATISLTVDNNGHLWSATGKDGHGVGILEFDDDNWITHNSNNLPTIKYNDFHKVSSSKNSVFFNSWGEGFIQYKDGNYRTFNAETTEIIGVPENINYIVIDDVQVDSKENIWVLNFWATNKKPLSVLTPENDWYHFQFANSIIPTIVRAENLVIDQFSTKWFGVTGLGEEGLYYFNENGTLNNLSDDIWGRITKHNGLRDKIVKALAIDKFGELLIGTSIGVDVITDPSEPNVDNNQYLALSNQTINCIAVDPINQKWFGTTKGVFFTSSDGSRLLASFNKSNSPIPDNDIKSIAIDENSGIVYIGTNMGITAITTMFIKPKSDLSELFVYPNPVTIDNSSNLNIIFDGLIENSQIKILDISGKLIYEFSSIGGRTTFWDLKDFNGQYISSGIYIAVVYDNEANKVAHTKFAVIRK